MEARRRVLFVDDNADIAGAYAAILTHHDFDVLTASDGASALEIAFRFRPDVVVMDLWMPAMDGFDTTRALKADPRTEQTPVIAFTSLGYTERKAKDAGCDAFLRKGGAPEELLNVIRSFLPR